jgi:glycosyltransferase involved in cell wall biosynthesis
MRILFHHRIGSADGQAVHIEEMSAALRRQGHEIILVGPPAFATTGFGGSNALIDSLKRSMPAALYEVLELVYNLKAFVRLFRAVRRHRPDVIYERFSLFLFAGLWVRRLTGIPVLLEVNAPLFEERAKNDGLRLASLGRWAQGLLWRGMDHVLPVTGVLGRTVAAYGVAPERISVIPNGINPERFATASGSRVRDRFDLSDRLVLGFTGFIRGWNAVHHLLDFAAEHQHQFDLHVLVVGDGPARESLQDHATALGVADRLTITGIVARDDIASHVAAFDIAVLPGLTPYSSPLKLFEYLQLGRAIVAPDTENIREVLRHGENALLFAPDQPESLDSCLLRLCEDAALRANLGVEAERTIEAQALTWDNNARRVASIAKAAIETPVVTPNKMKRATQGGVAQV